MQYCNDITGAAAANSSAFIAYKQKAAVPTSLHTFYIAQNQSLSL